MNEIEISKQDFIEKAWDCITDFANKDATPKFIRDAVWCYNDLIDEIFNRPFLGEEDKENE